MGEYTGLRFKAVIKPEYAKYIEELVHTDMESFKQLYSYYPEELPFLKEFVETKFYAQSIGVVGGDSYMPDTWCFRDIPEDSQTYNLFALDYDPTTRIYQFATVNKDSDNSMAFFLQKVAPHLIERVIAIYTHFNESSLYRCYNMENGLMVEVAAVRADYEGFSTEVITTKDYNFKLTEELKLHLDWRPLEGVN